VADDEHRTGNLPLGDGVVDDGIENGEAGIERSLGERGGRKQERTETRSAVFGMSVSRLL
jgi:hypothetical protein